MKKLNKKDGSIMDFIIPLGFLILLCVVINYLLVDRHITIARDDIEDSLVSATLAAATFNTELYGTSKDIVITDNIQAFNNFKKSLKENLELNDSMVPLKSNSAIKSEVILKNFIIYNVVGNDVKEINRSETGNITEINHANGKGVVTTPKGEYIKNTTVYTKIEFAVGEFMGISKNDAIKDCTVDLTDE